MSIFTNRVDKAALWALDHAESLYALEIMEAVGRSAGNVYASLMRLERANEVMSWWDQPEPPRRRVYARVKDEVLKGMKWVRE